MDWQNYPVWELVLGLGLVAASTMIVAFGVFLALGLLLRRCAPDGWTRGLALRARMPLMLLILGTGLGKMLGQAVPDSYDKLHSSLETGQSLLGVVALCWFLLRVVDLAWESISQPQRIDVLPLPKLVRQLDNHTRYVTYMILRIVVWGMFALLMLQTLGVNLTGILAIGGIGGIIIGFASKEMLTDTFSSLTLLWSNEFKVGDWIKVRGNNIEGIVESITWRKTCVRSLDKRLIHVPNSMLASSVIENISMMTHRRINETIGLRYSDIDKVPVVIERIRKMLTEHAGIDEQSTFLVWFDSYGESSVNIKVICMTKSTDGGKSFEHKQDVLLSIARIVEDSGADFAFPTRTVQLVQKALDPD